MPGFAICFGLASVTRPEAVVLLPVCAVLIFMVFKEKGYLQKALMVGLMCVPNVLWSLFCLFTNGHLLPNTFYVKSEPVSIGFDKIGLAFDLILQHGYGSVLIFFMGLAMFVLYLIWGRQKHSLLYLGFFVATPLGYAVAVIATRSVEQAGYYWSRYVDPASLLLTIPCCIGLAMLVRLPTSSGFALQNSKLFKKIQFKHPVFVISIISILCMLLAFPRFYKSYLNRRTHLGMDSRAISLLNVAAGLWIKDHIPKNARVGVNDAGATRYFGESKIIDLVGLNNKRIAFSKIPYEQTFLELDYLVVFPHLFENSNILENFQLQKSFSIPMAEYTICPCPGQNRISVYRKKKNPHRCSSPTPRPRQASSPKKNARS